MFVYKCGGKFADIENIKSILIWLRKLNQRADVIA